MKMLVACLFFELSQHPTCPHVRTDADAPSRRLISNILRSRQAFARGRFDFFNV
jgi:hypothetical protein